jgi:SNF2 family DNA or RNA helicase
LLLALQADVEVSLPPKKEVILYTHLTDLQRQYYSALMKERTDVQDGKGAMKRLMDEKNLERNQALSSSMSLQVNT